jgi:hypothetical protein
VLALGCASLGVRTDYDHEASFTALSRYAWMDSTRVVRDQRESPFLEDRVRRAVDRVLGQRGFVADSQHPDFLVTALVIGPSRGEREWRYWPAAPCGSVTSISIGFGYPYGYDLWNPWWPWRSPYYRYPWGYACSYRVGYGYIWFPVYRDPGSRLAGTLVIDVMDAQDRRLIWRGSAEGAVSWHPGDSPSQEELNEVAGRILKEFPPGAKR